MIKKGRRGKEREQGGREGERKEERGEGRVHKKLSHVHVF